MRILSFLLSVFLFIGIETSAQNSLPYFENFEGNPLDSGWTKQQPQGSPGWAFSAESSAFSYYWYPQPDHPEYGNIAIANDDKCSIDCNCSCNYNGVYLISPAILLYGHTAVTLKFEAFFQGISSSKGYVILSTGTGINWVDTLFSMSSNPSWQEITVDLTPFIADSIINIGFYYKDAGPTQSFGFAVDGVNIYEPLLHDLGITDWVLPSSGCGLLSSTPVSVKIHNYGYYNATGFTVSYSLNGGSTYITEPVSTTVAPGADYTYTFSQHANLSLPGVYTFIFLVTLTGDQVSSNNTATSASIQSYLGISAFPFTENFESGNSNYFYLQQADQSNAQFTTDGSNHVVLLQGGDPNIGWTGMSGTTAQNAWVDNISHIASINTCTINATGISTLKLKFDLKQKTSGSLVYSWFRVLLNNIQLSDINGVSNFNPATQQNDPYTTRTFDLTPYAGTQFTLTFQASNLYNSANASPASQALIDNIRLVLIDLAQINVSGTINNVTCFNGHNGSINLSVTGGVTPYTYHWSNGATIQNLNNRSAGTYTVTVTDNASTVGTASFTVTQPAAITASSTITNVSCFGSNTGSVSMTISGGITPYTYHWSNGATTLNINNVPAGIYYITVTGPSGCSTTSSVTIAQATQISTSGTIQNVSANGGSDGSVVLSVSGGVTPYSYHWSNNATTKDISGITAGTYYVTVTDANACTLVSTFTVTQPGISLGVTAVQTNVVCHGESNGTINITASGGITPYGYQWSNGSTTQNQTGLQAGIYTVTVTDSQSISATVSNTITEPAAFTASSGSTAIMCHNGTSIVTVTATGGVGPYSGTGGFTVNAGTYTYSVTDANGCTASTTITITEPSVLTASSGSTTVQCYGGSSTVTITATGSVVPYSGVGNYTVTTGTYTYTVTDANGCTATTTVTVSQPADILITESQVNVSGYGLSDGSVSISVTGGTAGYGYVWSNGTTGQAITGLQAGVYTVTVTDAHGCTKTGSYTISQPSGIFYNIPFSENFEGMPSNSGWISLQAPNPDGCGWIYGYGPDMFEPIFWYPLSNIDSTNIAISNDDVLNCDRSMDYLISPFIILGGGYVNYSLSFSSFFTGDYGSTAEVLISTSWGGSLNNLQTLFTLPPITDYGWTTHTVNLSSYGGDTIRLVFHHNDNGQWASGFALDNVMVMGSNPEVPITITSTTVNNQCHGGMTGSIDITVSGGITPYSYHWSNGSTTQDQTGLQAGNYLVTVTDSHSVTATGSYTITEPAVLTASSGSTAIMCNGGSSTVTINATGGVGPYSGTGGLTVNAGTYTYTLTDANGCTANTTVTVT
ncbi:MAG: choice-of-anchor J domain-containing protein, partial [Bacteroidia bacterium]|nr:choice-of-anchor J domain-containing protein [Bacteroidia bacterium]